jgi:hypothetical protein
MPVTYIETVRRITATELHDREFKRLLDEHTLPERHPYAYDHRPRQAGMTIDQMRKRVSEETLRGFMAAGSRDRAGSDANKSRILLPKPARAVILLNAIRAFRQAGWIRAIDRLTMSGHAVYEAGGYMGWHNNADQPGLRIYCSFAREPARSGLHYFYPGEDDRRRTLYDDAGWNFRMFQTDVEPPFWHAVWSESYRISVGFRVLQADEPDRAP